MNEKPDGRGPVVMSEDLREGMEINKHELESKEVLKANIAKTC